MHLRTLISDGLTNLNAVFSTRFPLPTLQCESDLFYYYLVFCKFFPYNLVFVLLKSVRKVTFFQAEGTWEPSVETFRSQCDTCVLYFPPNSQEILCWVVGFNTSVTERGNYILNIFSSATHLCYCATTGLNLSFYSSRK